MFIRMLIMFIHILNTVKDLNLQCRTMALSIDKLPYIYEH